MRGKQISQMESPQPSKVITRGGWGLFHISERLHHMQESQKDLALSTSWCAGQFFCLFLKPQLVQKNLVTAATSTPSGTEEQCGKQEALVRVGAEGIVKHISQVVAFLPTTVPITKAGGLLEVCKGAQMLQNWPSL